MLVRISNRTYLLLSIGLLLLWVCLVTIFRGNLGSSIRFFNDDADRQDYFLRGSWLPTGKVPYRDVISEYPQIPTFIFGILYLPFLNQVDSNAVYLKYSNLFSFLMLCLLICLITTLGSMLPEKKKKLAYFLLLPAPLYFAYNRFDVLPTLIVVLALFMISKEKWEFAGILLGIGTLTKWYPALVVLPVITYMVYRKISIIKIGLFLILFGTTCLVILSPTYFMGGLKAILSPYIFHSNRGFEIASLPTFLEPMIKIIIPFENENSMKTVYVLLQISVLPLVIFNHIDSFEKLLSWCLLIISFYILFSRIYSPQWLLWIFPFMILLTRDKFDIAILILYGTITYIEFPVVYDLFGPESSQMALMGWVNIILLIMIIFQTSRRLILLRSKILASEISNENI